MRLTLPCMLVLAAACRGPVTRPIDTEPPPPPATCGDGVIAASEQCDASDLVGATCQSLGFDTGRLQCSTTTCQYDTSLCVKRCGNGVLDLGEACDGILGVPACTTWGGNRCSAECTVDTRFCVTTAFEAGPNLELTKGGPAFLVDLAPAGPGDLVVTVPSFARLEIYPWTMTQGFELANNRKLSFLRSPVAAERIDANADALADLVAVNRDGTFDLIVNEGSTYGLHSLDAGCVDAHFLPSHGRSRPAAYAVGCGGVWTITGTGASKLETPAATAATEGPSGIVWADGQPSLHFADGGTSTITTAITDLGAGDFDSDGDADLATITAQGIELLENTGTGFATRGNYSSPGATTLRVLDLDGDGWVDLSWSTGSDVIVRRNRGQFVFTETVIPVGAGTRLSTAWGDADGDSDLDLAVTFSTGTDSSRTKLFTNRSH